MVASIDEEDVDRSLRELPGGPEATEAAANDHDAGTRGHGKR